MISDEEKFMSATLSVNEPEFAAYVALDWGDTEHAWSLEEAGGGKREQGKLRQTPEAIEAWATELAARFGGRPVAVALEQSRGALIYSLQKFSHLVFYPIHPSTSSKYRAAMFPSGSKDDPVDGDLLLDLLVRHRDRLRPLRADSPETRKLQSLVEKRRQLVDDLTAHKNRITALLKIYYPQALHWFDDLSSPLAVAFLQRWPTLPPLQNETPDVVRKFFHTHGSRSTRRIDQRLAEIQQAKPALEDQAIMDPCVRMVEALLQIVAILHQAIAGMEKAIEEVFTHHPDAAIFTSFPGAGKVMAPRLLAALGSQRDRWGCVTDFQNYTGVPPVTVRSGKSLWVHFRWACPKFLRQTFHEFAGLSIQQSEWARAFYDHRRQVVSQDHHAAIRALAFKWQRILFRCWIDRKPYQEALYQRSLLKRSPPPPQALSDTSHRSRTKPPNSSGSNPVHFQFKKVAGFCKLVAPAS
jgi:transposase